MASDRNAWAKLIRALHLQTAKAFPPKFHRPPWIRRPDTIIGAYVESRFGQQWYVGRVARTYFDHDNNCDVWTVEYDGGDEFNYYAAQLSEILCDDLHALVV
jgi:hypothetical protein